MKPASRTPGTSATDIATRRVVATLIVGIEPEDPRRVGNLADFVLSPFGKDERAVVVELLPRLQDAVEIWMRDGILKAMNAHNGGDATRK